MDQQIEANGVKLAAYLARPSGAARVPGLILCHGYPTEGRSAAAATYPLLADRLAQDAGWAVLSFNFRGAGASSGNFSIQGWIDDLHAVVDWMEQREDVAGIWIAGASLGGAIAIAEAGDDSRVRGVATLGAPMSLRDWAKDTDGFLQSARELGVIEDDSYPPNAKAWGKEIKDFEPLSAAEKLAPRELFILHGSEDDVVPPSDARAFYEASRPHAELHILYAGGHRLRHDPRAVALLLGWLDRQLP